MTAGETGNGAAIPPPSGETSVAGEADEPRMIDLLPDELILARAQLDAGQPILAEGTLRRRLAWLEADNPQPDDETDTVRALLAEALWRQGRLAAARTALDAIRPSSPQRRLPITLVIEAESLASAGERDRAAGAMERVIAAIGVDAAFELVAGVPGRVGWPLPASLRHDPPGPAHPPWTTRAAPSDGAGPASGKAGVSDPEILVDEERIAAARGRMEEARVAYVAGDLERGDGEMSIAVRLDPALAGDGVAILEPTLGGQPTAERLLLYGDLLRAAGRDLEASEAYDRAAGRRS